MGYRPGDHVVYPAYGAGTIVATEDRVFAGTTTSYYILRMVADEGEFMVPVDQADSLGVRPVSKRGLVVEVLESAPEELSEDYKERQAGIEKLLATSDAVQLSYGARDLAWYSGKRQLTGKDIQLYEELQTQLASELALSENMELEEAREKLAGVLDTIAQKSEAKALAEAEQEETD